MIASVKYILLSNAKYEHIEIRLHRSNDFFFKRINVNVGLLESQEYANSFLAVWHGTFRAHKKSKAEPKYFFSMLQNMGFEF